MEHRFEQSLISPKKFGSIKNLTDEASSKNMQKMFHPQGRAKKKQMQSCPLEIYQKHKNQRLTIILGGSVNLSNLPIRR